MSNSFYTALLFETTLEITSWVIILIWRKKKTTAHLPPPVDTDTQKSLLSLSATHKSDLHQVQLIMDEETDEDVDILNDSSDDGEISDLAEDHIPDDSLSEEDTR